MKILIFFSVIIFFDTIFNPLLGIKLKICVNLLFYLNLIGLGNKQWIII